MTIVYENLMAIEIPEVEQSYTPRDTMLYALAIGLGHDPVDETALSYCFEKNLRAFPTMAVVLGHPGFWMRDLNTGIDWKRSVHGEQHLIVHKVLPTSGTVIGKTRVLDVLDKGPGRGAIVRSERKLYDKHGELLATSIQTSFCRNDGGFGGPRREVATGNGVPERAPDQIVDLPTRPEGALLFRLNADPNPLHADPAVAKEAGFPRPILHGLASYGVACHAVLKGLCNFDAALLRSFSLRFVSPVYPGETICTELWRDGNAAHFRCSVRERNTVVINDGWAEFNR